MTTEVLATLVLGRVIERIVIVVIAGLTVVLGWELMRRRLGTGDAEIHKGGIRIALRRVAPGVFFALFGATILTYSLAKPLSYNDDRIILYQPSKPVADSTGQPSEKVLNENTSKLSYAHTAINKDEALKIVLALNKAIRISTIDRENNRVLRPAIEDIVRSVNEYTVVRNNILVSQIGRDNLDLWNAKGSRFREAPDRLPRDERDRLGAISQWFEVE